MFGGFEFTSADIKVNRTSNNFLKTFAVDYEIN